MALTYVSMFDDFYKDSKPIYDILKPNYHPMIQNFINNKPLSWIVPISDFEEEVDFKTYAMPDDLTSDSNSDDEEIKLDDI